MDNRPIGVFDSGLGGLTTIRELKAILPNEDIVYFGDTGRVPYGTRSHEIIKKYARQDIRFLVSQDVKYIIAACGTASSVITPEDISEYDIAYTGVPFPASSAAAKLTANKRIGVIGTSATIKSRTYNNAMHAIDSDIQVFSTACPLFVPLVENGFINRNNQITKLVAEQYLNPLKLKDIDTLILGCTHYPIIKDIIGDIMGSNVTLIDSGQEAARLAFDMLSQSNMLNQSKKIGECRYYVSDTVENFSENASIILSEPVNGQVEKIDIENY